MTDLRNNDRHALVGEESDPILKMVMTPDQSSIWVATSGSSLNNWVGIYIFNTYLSSLKLKFYLVLHGNLYL